MPKGKVAIKTASRSASPNETNMWTESTLLGRLDGTKMHTTAGTIDDKLGSACEVLTLEEHDYILHATLNAR